MLTDSFKKGLIYIIKNRGSCIGNDMLRCFAGWCPIYKECQEGFATVRKSLQEKYSYAVSVYIKEYGEEELCQILL